MVGPNSNIINMQTFTAEVDVPFEIGITNTVLLLPFFQMTDCGWVDATGSYDLCMDNSGRKFFFTNRLGGPAQFAYRYYTVKASC